MCFLHLLLLQRRIGIVTLPSFRLSASPASFSFLVHKHGDVTPKEDSEQEPDMGALTCSQRTVFGKPTCQPECIIPPRVLCSLHHIEVATLHGSLDKCPNLSMWHCKTVKGDNLERQEGHTGEEAYFYPYLEIGIQGNAL